MKRKNSTFNRVFTTLVFLFLYAPILLLIVFSFNEGSSNSVWTGFSLHWYKELFHDRLIMRSVYTTLLVSLIATVIATFAGTFAAIAMVMMIIVVVCMVVMNRFGEGEEQAVLL